MTKLSGLEKRIGILGATAVSVIMLVGGCNSPIMENRAGVPSASRELGHQKDNALGGGSARSSYSDVSQDDSLLPPIAEDNAQTAEDNAAAPKKDQVPVVTGNNDEFPPMENMQKKAVGPKKAVSQKAVVVDGYYTVVEGDSLSLIAKKLKVKRKDLIAANNITNPNKIRVGQKLRVPGKTVKTETPAPAKEVDSSLVVNGLYTVVANDSVSKIAKKLHVTRAALMQENNLTEQSILQIGQKLRVPGAKVAEEADPVIETTTNTDNSGDFGELTEQLGGNQSGTTTDTANEGATVVTDEGATTTDTTTSTSALPSVVEVEADITVDEFCKKYNITKEFFEQYNSIPADGVITKGSAIFFTAE